MGCLSRPEDSEHRLLLDRLGKGSYSLGLIRLVGGAARQGLGIGATGTRDRDTIHRSGVAVVLAVAIGVRIGARERVVRRGGEF